MFQYYVSGDLICVTWYYRETFISMQLTCYSFKVGFEKLGLRELFAIHIFLNAQVTKTKWYTRKDTIFWHSFQYPFTWCDPFCWELTLKK